MRLGVIPENVVERVMLWFGLPPAGVFESWVGMMLTRAMMAATRLGVFEVLAEGPRTVDEVASACSADPTAMQRLLNALVGAKCLQRRGEHYILPKRARQWLLKEGKHSFHDQILLHYLEWGWWDHCEEYIKTGRPLSVHTQMDDEQWGVYQRGMRAGIEWPARWIARVVPLRKDASAMLDIGGAHGHFSAAICRRYPKMRSVVLELPEAIRHAAPILAQEGLGDRIVHRAGDARCDDLGEQVYDLVFLSAVVHHFDAATNRELMKRIARCLRPGGAVAIWEVVRQDGGGKVRQVGGLMDLFFGLFSRSGSWTPSEIAGWLQAAELKPDRPRHAPLLPDLALHVGRKSD